MPKNLKIATFDVGQGESSLVIAQNTGPGPPYLRTMLIDGGLQGKVTDVNTAVIDRLQVAGMVIDHITANAPATRVNAIVVSHFDVDHSGGIVNLLAADNLCALCYLITGNIQSAYDDYVRTAPTDTIRAIITGLVHAILYGGYNIPGAANPAMTALLVDIKQRASYYATTMAWYAAGITAAIDVIGTTTTPLNHRLIPTNQKINTLTQAAGASFENNPANLAELKNEIFDSVFSELCGYIKPCLKDWQPENYYTYGLYRNTMLVDPGNSLWMPTDYSNVLEGKLSMSNTLVSVPGIARTRIKPELGTELLWLDNPTTPRPHTSADPEAYVFSCDRRIWNPGGHNQEIALIGIDNNATSISMVIRFGDFWFYTGGDLPAEGENYIAQNIFNHGIRTGRGSEVLQFPHKLAAFKCGHHGADTCTSDYFLDTLKPVAAVISCGRRNSYQHPSPSLLTRLKARPLIPQRIFLTEMFSLESKREELPVAGKAIVAGNAYLFNEIPGVTLTQCIYGDILIDVPEPGPLPGLYSVTCPYTADPGDDDDIIPANHRFGVDYVDRNVQLHI